MEDTASSIRKAFTLSADKIRNYKLTGILLNFGIRDSDTITTTMCYEVDGENVKGPFSISKNMFDSIASSINETNSTKVDYQYNESVLMVRSDSFTKLVAWYEPPAVKKIRFDKRKINCAVPGSVFVVRNDKIYHFSTIKDFEKAHWKKCLAKSVMYNVWSSNEVCVGSARWDDSSDVSELITNASHAFWNGGFTHRSNDQKQFDYLFEKNSKEFDQYELLEKISWHAIKDSEVFA